MKKLLISLLVVGTIASTAFATPVFAHHGTPNNNSACSNNGICPNNGVCTHSTYCKQDGSCLVDGVCTNKDCSLYGKDTANSNNHQRGHGNGHGHGCANRNSVSR